MPQIQSQLDPHSDAFARNRAAMLAAIEPFLCGQCERCIQNGCAGLRPFGKFRGFVVFSGDFGHTSKIARSFYFLIFAQSLPLANACFAKQG